MDSNALYYAYGFPYMDCCLWKRTMIDGQKLSQKHSNWQYQESDPVSWPPFILLLSDSRAVIEIVLCQDSYFCDIYHDYFLHTIP